MLDAGRRPYAAAFDKARLRARNLFCLSSFSFLFDAVMNRTR